MKLENEIELNKFGQDLVGADSLLERFKLLDANQKREYLISLACRAVKSKERRCRSGDYYK